MGPPKPAPVPLVTARAALVAVLFARHRGVDAARLLAPLGTTVEALSAPELQVPLSWIAHLWTEAPRLTGDPAFGVHAAELATRQRGHVLDYVASVCASPREFFDAATRYQRLLLSRSEMELREEGPWARFEARARPPGRPPQMDAFVLAQVALRLRGRSPSGFPLRRVDFEHTPAPEAEPEYARVLGAEELRFAQPVDLLEFRRELLEEALREPDPTLLAMLRSHAASSLERVKEPTAEQPSGAATLALRAELERVGLVTQPDLARLARSLGQSERSLQRRLSEEGTSFKKLLDDLRRDQALRFLADERQSVTDVSFLLGFGEVSAFSRAFRRWTGESPAGWRRALPGGHGQTVGGQ